MILSSQRYSAVTIVAIVASVSLEKPGFAVAPFHSFMANKETMSSAVTIVAAVSSVSTVGPPRIKIKAADTTVSAALFVNSRSHRI